MAIPLSNMQKEVKTPNAGRAQALDLTQEAQASIAMARDFSGSIARGTGNAILGALQYKKNQQDIQDMTVGNEAYNEYMRDMNDLNAIRVSKDGAEAVAFEQEYNKKANEYHNKLLGVLDNQITNPTVRENVRQHVNSYNQKNRGHAFTFFDKARKDYQATTAAAANQNTVNNAKPNFLNGQTTSNVQQMNNMFADLDANTIAIMASRGYQLIPDNGNLTKFQKDMNAAVQQVIHQAVQQTRQAALNEITEYLDETNTDLGSWRSSASSIALVKQLQKSGAIDDVYARQKLKQLQANQMSVELKRNPEQFYDVNSGRFLSENRTLHCPEMTQAEYEQVWKKFKSGASGQGKAQKQISTDMYRHVYDILAQNGAADLGDYIAELAGLDKDNLGEIKEQSRKDNPTFMYNPADIAKMRNFLQGIYGGRVAVDAEGRLSALSDTEDAPNGTKYINLRGSDAIQKTISLLDDQYRASLRTSDYNRMLKTKMLRNNRPTTSTVVGGVLGDIMHDYQHTSWAGNLWRKLTGDTSKQKSLGVFQPGEINASVYAKVTEALAPYKIDADAVENDSYDGKIIFKKDAQGNDIPNTGISYNLVVSKAMAEGIVQSIGAKNTRELFGGEAQLQKMILQRSVDFNTKRQQTELAKEDLKMGALGAIPVIGLPTAVMYKGSKMLTRAVASIPGKIKAERTNIINERAKNTDDALKKNAADILGGTDYTEKGEINFPDSVKAKMQDVALNYPYPNKDMRPIANLINESLWGSIQYDKLPDQETYMNDTGGTEDSYRAYLSHNIAKEDAFSLLRDDGVLDHVENKLDLIRVDGNAAKEVRKGYMDYLQGSGIYSSNLRNAITPHVMDAYGNFNVQMPQEEYKQINYPKAIKESIKEASKEPRAKLYFASPNEQYYISKDGEMHLLRLPSNDLYLNLMLMSGYSYKPSQKPQVSYALPQDRQYVDGGAFKRSFYGNTDNVRVLTSSEDFSFR